jgi:hypothetical protein
MRPDRLSLKIFSTMTIIFRAWRYCRVMEIQAWLPLLNAEYRRWIESHPYAVLAEPVLDEIEQVGGPARDDDYWSHESLWDYVDRPDPRFLPREAVEWIHSFPDRCQDPDAGKPHPSAVYFKNRGRWNR